MRVGLDARYAFRRQRRGIGEYVAALLHHLPDVAAADDAFVLYVDGPADPPALPLPDARFSLRQLPAANPLLWEEVALPRAARRDRLDLLHLTSNYGPSAPPCPTVYTIHDLIEFLRPQFGRVRLPFRHAAGRAVRIRTLPAQARRAAAVITVSEASRRDLVRLLALPSDRIHVVPHGITVEAAPAADPAAVRAELRGRGLAVPETYVLAMGALDARKNGPFLMRGFADVATEFPEAQLWIVGVERISAYPLPWAQPPAWLQVRGFAPREDLVRLISGATAFAYPSLYEGFGFPALEAMACGVPVVASDRSSLPEVVGDAGLLFDPTDQAALAAALRRILEDPGLRRQLVARGRQRLARFSWESAARATYAVYRDAAAAARLSAAR